MTEPPRPPENSGGTPQDPYTPPPPPNYPPAPGGMPTPGAPAGFANNDEKTWALIAHFGGAAGAFIGGGGGGWVAPLIALLAKGNESPTVRAHAIAALNFQILWSIIAVVSWVLTCIVIGILGVLVAVVMGVVFGLIAGLKANEGVLYKYPASISLVK